LFAAIAFLITKPGSCTVVSLPRDIHAAVWKASDRLLMYDGTQLCDVALPWELGSVCDSNFEDCEMASVFGFAMLIGICS